MRTVILVKSGSEGFRTIWKHEMKRMNIPGMNMSPIFGLGFWGLGGFTVFYVRVVGGEREGEKDVSEF
jgi:hypothetical protein